MIQHMIPETRLQRPLKKGTEPADHYNYEDRLGAGHDVLSIMTRWTAKWPRNMPCESGGSPHLDMSMTDPDDQSLARHGPFIPKWPIGPEVPHTRVDLSHAAKG